MTETQKAQHYIESKHSMPFSESKTNGGGGGNEIQRSYFEQSKTISVNYSIALPRTWNVQNTFFYMFIKLRISKYNKLYLSVLLNLQ